MSPPPARRRAPRLSGEERIANILATARRMIREKGYEDVSMLEIAEEAGIVEGTIYRYFETKKALLEKVAEEWFTEHLSEETDLSSIRGTWNRLRHLVWRGLDITRREPVLSRYLLTELRSSAGFRSSPFFNLNRKFTSQIRRLCAEAISSGEFRNDVSTSVVRDMIFGCIEHQTWAYLRNEGTLDIDKTADGITTVIYRGMAVPEGTMKALAAPIRRLETLGERIERLARPA